MKLKDEQQYKKTILEQNSTELANDVTIWLSPCLHQDRRGNNDILTGNKLLLQADFALTMTTRANSDGQLCPPPTLAFCISSFSRVTPRFHK